jgi:hypothetical protein
MANDLTTTVRNPGIVAACCLINNELSMQVFRMLEMHSATVENIRVDLSKETVINVRHQDGYMAGIASVKGHSITKSLQRMLRRILKNVAKGSQPVSGISRVPSRLPERPPAPPQAPATIPPSPTPSVPLDPSADASVSLDGEKTKDPNRPW